MAHDNKTTKTVTPDNFGVTKLESLLGISDTL